MPGMRAGRSSRGRYTSAGYHYRDEAAERSYEYPKDRVGSARDKMRNGEDRQGDSPEPALAYAPNKVRQERRRSRPKKSFFERISDDAHKKPGAVVFCAVMLIVILYLGVLDIRQVVARAQLQDIINTTNGRVATLKQDNEILNRRIEEAKSKTIIDNRAQNELKMLRPERAQTDVIYIKIPDVVQTKQEESVTRSFSLQDIVLGLFSIVHIGE